MTPSKDVEKTFANIYYQFLFFRNNLTNKFLPRDDNSGKDVAGGGTIAKKVHAVMNNNNINQTVPSVTDFS